MGSSLASNGIDVYWNHNLIFSAPGTSIGNYNIHTQSFILDAVEGQNSFTLMSTGTSDGTGMTVDNIEMYKLDDGNREEVNTTNGTLCLCKPGYFDDGTNFTCVSCASVFSGCADCEYNVSNTTFNTSFLTCLDCLDGYYF